jgi:hypothetical protein
MCGHYAKSIVFRTVFDAVNESTIFSAARRAVTPLLLIRFDRGYS